MNQIQLWPQPETLITSIHQVVGLEKVCTGAQESAAHLLPSVLKEETVEHKADVKSKKTWKSIPAQALASSNWGSEQSNELSKIMQSINHRKVWDLILKWKHIITCTESQVVYISWFITVGFTVVAPWIREPLRLAGRRTLVLMCLTLSGCVIKPRQIMIGFPNLFHLGNGGDKFPHPKQEEKTDSTDKAAVTLPGTHWTAPAPSSQKLRALFLDFPLLPPYTSTFCGPNSLPLIKQGKVNETPKEANASVRLAPHILNSAHAY